MGFDIHGLNTTINKEKPEILTSMETKDGWRDWKKFEKLTDKQKDAYWKADDEYNEANPGIYFRNNNWWWRPLWDYVCEVCEDVMSGEDIEAGYSNSGNQLDEHLLERMLVKLQIEIALGNHIKYEKAYKEKLDSLPLQTCECCKGTGVRQWDDGDEDCNVCNTEYSREKGIPVGKVKQWQTSYPFSAENVERFVSFLEQSGGIEIC